MHPNRALAVTATALLLGAIALSGCTTASSVPGIAVGPATGSRWICSGAADHITRVDRRQECRQLAGTFIDPKLPPFPQPGDARFIPRTGLTADRHR
jgi:hypothetical protein